MEILDMGARFEAHEWRLYRSVLWPALGAKLPFALGGGLVFSMYTGRWRHTKDMDLFMREEDRAHFVEILCRAGFEDYYDRLPYDRAWIYRGFRDGVIVDLIWQMANYRARVEEEWLLRARPLKLGDLQVRMLAPEEILWTKLYVFQRERLDWPDLLNLLLAQPLDWQHVLLQVGSDALLLGGLLNVFRWACPGRARTLPCWLWERVGLAPPSVQEGPDIDWRRIEALDSRDWFGPKEGKPC